MFVSHKDHNVAVLGAGAWGTALANVLAADNPNVTLFVRDQELYKSLQQTHKHPRSFPEITLSDNLRFEYDLTLLKNFSIIFLAVPVQKLRECLTAIYDLLDPHSIMVATCKGIEQSTRMFVTQIMQSVLKKKVEQLGVLSGPSFAYEVIRFLPTAVTLAFKEVSVAQNLAERLSCESLKIYYTNDVRGVEIGGALKNVYAIGLGVVTGLRLGHNAHAALLTRAFVEMKRFANTFGGLQETLTGLSGLGDLILTTSSELSRNYSFGIGLAQHNTLAHSKSKFLLVEGIHTVHAVLDLAQSYKLAMPICSSISKAIDSPEKLKDIVANVLQRPTKHETSLDHN